MYQFNENGLRTRMFWIRGGRSSMPEAPRAALAVSAEEIYIFGVSVLYIKFTNASHVVYFCDEM